MYPNVYATFVSTWVSNALFVGLVCDRIGQKVALVFISLLVVLGATPGTVTRGATIVPKAFLVDLCPWDNWNCSYR